MGAGYTADDQTEDQGNRMADAIEKFLEDGAHVESFTIPATLLPQLFDLRDAAEAWRSDGGRNG